MEQKIEGKEMTPFEVELREAIEYFRSKNVPDKEIKDTLEKVFKNIK